MSWNNIIPIQVLAIDAELKHRGWVGVTTYQPWVGAQKFNGEREVIAEFGDKVWKRDLIAARKKSGLAS